MIIDLRKSCDIELKIYVEECLCQALFTKDVVLTETHHKYESVFEFSNNILLLSPSTPLFHLPLSKRDC